MNPPDIVSKEQLGRLSWLLEQAKTRIDAEVSDDESSDNGDIQDNNFEDDYDFSTEPELAPEERFKLQVECLMDLLPALDQNRSIATSYATKAFHSTGSIPITLGPAYFFTSLVREKFPLASPSLTESLGDANWRRNSSIRATLERVASQPGRNGTDLKYTIGRDPSFRDSGIGPSLAAQSEYAASVVASHTSFISSVADEEKGKLRVPKTPAEVAADVSFQCPSCGIQQHKIKTRIDWK